MNKVSALVCEDKGQWCPRGYSCCQCKSRGVRAGFLLVVILEQYLRLSRPHCRHTANCRRKGSQSMQQSSKARSALRHGIPEMRSRAWWVCIPHSVWKHLQLLDLGGSHRQPLVQGRTFGEETGLPLPEVDALSVVHLTPGMGHGLQACCQGLSGQRAGGGFPMAMIFRL